MRYLIAQVLSMACYAACSWPFYDADVVPVINDFSHYNNTGSLPDIAEEYRRSCPMSNLCTVPLNSSAITSHTSNCCGKCSCSRNCIKERNCCPDILQYLNESVFLKTESCVRPQLLDFGVTNNSNQASFFMIDKCAPSYSDMNIKKRCEDELPLPLTYQELLSFIPAVVYDTKKLYRNQFCGICNYEDRKNLSLWNTYTECSSKQDFKPTSFFELISKIIEDKKCNLVFRPENIMVNYDKICDIGEITKCNQTGHMKQYDLALEEKCNMFTSLYLEKYRNVFCYMCNSNKDPRLCQKDGDSAPLDLVSFNALLDYSVVSEDAQPRKETDTIQSNSCSKHQKYDNFKGICRDIVCEDGYQYVNDTCRNYFAMQNIRSYDLFVTYFAENNSVICLSRSASNAMFDDIKIDLQSAGLFDDTCTVTIAYSQGRQPCADNATSIEYVLAHVEISMANVHSIDKLMESLIIIDAKNVTILLPNENSTVVMTKTVSGRSYGVAFGENVENRKYRDPISMNNLEYFYSYVNSMPSFLMVCDLPVRLKRIRKYQQCPRTKLNFSEYRHEITRKGICFPDIDFCIKDGEYSTECGASEVCVCSGPYFSHIKNMKDRTSTLPDHCNSVITGLQDVRVLFSLVTTIISMTSLVCTIFTYSLFSSLRTVPGMNNLCLSITLLIAQVLYQFGMGQRSLGLGCKILGGLIHYFWLSTMCWMNICSIHMYRVFANLRAKQLGSRQKEVSTLLKYFLYCTTLPLIPVLTNVTVSLLLSDASDVGYGGCLCYISNPQMIAYTFALPIGVIVSVNLVCFVCVSIMIHRAMSGKKSLHKKDQLYLGIYMRLSCLTGLAWIFGFAHTWTQLEVLYYFFIVLNAGQGFFVFLAFVCNKRTLNLYLDLFRCSTILSKGSSRTQTTDTRTPKSSGKSSSKSSSKSSGIADSEVYITRL